LERFEKFADTGPAGGRSKALAILSCPGCSHRLRVPDKKRGTVACPLCGSEWFHPEVIGYPDKQIRDIAQSARDEIDDQFTEPTERNTPAYQPVETRTTIGRFKWLAICAVVASGLIYYVSSARQNTIAMQARLDLDKAVSILPLGTQEAWIEYVDRRVAAAIQLRSGTISVADLSDESKYVSRNTPYQVSCSPVMGGSIEFGYGDNSITVPIYGVLLDRSKAESPPPLDVTNSSLAAANLSRALCERIAISLNKILLP